MEFAMKKVFVFLTVCFSLFLACAKGNDSFEEQFENEIKNKTELFMELCKNGTIDESFSCLREEMPHHILHEGCLKAFDAKHEKTVLMLINFASPETVNKIFNHYVKNRDSSTVEKMLEKGHCRENLSKESLLKALACKNKKIREAVSNTRGLTHLPRIKFDDTYDHQAVEKELYRKKYKPNHLEKIKHVFLNASEKNKIEILKNKTLKSLLQEEARKSIPLLKKLNEYKDLIE